MVIIKYHGYNRDSNPWRSPRLWPKADAVTNEGTAVLYNTDKCYLYCYLGEKNPINRFASKAEKELL